MTRLFVALDLPESIKDQLADLTLGLGDVRWLLPEQQHLTLRFIGDIDNGRLVDVVEALAMVPGEPFVLRLKGLGHFPPRGELKALWVGVEKSSELNQLKARVDRALRTLDLPLETRKFVPHVTIGRLRRPPTPPRLATYLMTHGLFASEPFEVSSFELFSSWLRPEGADYQVEASFELVRDPDDGGWAA